MMSSDGRDGLELEPWQREFVDSREAYVPSGTKSYTQYDIQLSQFSWTTISHTESIADTIKLLEYDIEGFRGRTDFTSSASDVPMKMHQLAILYLTSKDFSNPTRALDLLKASRGLGSVRATFDMANFFARELPAKITPDCSPEILRFLGPEQARCLYEEAGRNGHQMAVCSLAYMYLTGKGGVQDYEKARDLFESVLVQSAQSERRITGRKTPVCFALFYLNKMFAEGLIHDDGGGDGLVRARNCCESAICIDGQFMPCAHELGMYLMYGIGGPVDLSRAKKLLIQVDSATSLLEAGVIELYEFTTSNGKYNIARTFFERAKEKKNRFAALMLHNMARCSAHQALVRHFNSLRSESLLGDWYQPVFMEVDKAKAAKLASKDLDDAWQKADESMRQLLLQEEQEKRQKEKAQAQGRKKKKKKKATNAEETQQPFNLRPGIGVSPPDPTPGPTIGPTPFVAQKEEGDQTSSLGGETTCIICFSDAKTHAAVPCGHVCACARCADILQATTGTCPYCNTKTLTWMQPRLV